MLRPLLLAALLSLAMPAGADTLWGSDVPGSRLVGQGEFRYLGFDIYTARLWSTRLPFDHNAPFALELTYHRSISRERFVDSSIDELRRLFGNALSEGKLARWRELMTLAFIDVEPGDQLVGVFLPGQGCRFYSRDRLLAVVRDSEFARDFFAIWLAPNTRDTGLRAQLTGGAP
ncbi:chalcone isomerase family protein [Crenobacter sp. SG2305]|uniref:chalcone isomerase family protein n=1 Tax=Crenobacter oryzisoli TaxID=3056844 RepID=UPI0025AA9BE8|nr:chalcone isomerase family protein [Crenobacter sp. SG2305]MDN0082836.1 chalcone isomerase family protein [Crenobacter sp. SG2305]